MTQDILEKLAALEALLPGTEASATPRGPTPGAALAAPWIEISADGTRAIGRGGLDIAYHGSNACPYGRSATRDATPFEAVVIHHTADDHDTDWYVQYQIDGDPGRGGHHFGYHFYVTPEGRVVQGAPLTKRTNHVKPSSHAQRKALGRHASNRNAVGISCVGAGTPAFDPTPRQESAASALAFALCSAFGIPGARVYGHGEIQFDRHESEGASVAAELRAGGAFGDGSAEDDLDDAPLHEVGSSARAVREDNDHLEADALVVHARDGADGSARGTAAGATATRIVYTNQSAIRNRPCTPNLERRIAEAVEAVHGPGCTVNIYSGGQDRKGFGTRRTGSVRHDDHGQGGRAADVHVFDATGRQIKALELARLGQHWLAAGFGCVGLEMRGGGIHLDEWTTPPTGGGRFWTYAASDAMPWGATSRAMLAQGAGGVFP